MQNKQNKTQNNTEHNLAVVGTSAKVSEKESKSVAKHEFKVKKTNKKTASPSDVQTNGLRYALTAVLMFSETLRVSTLNVRGTLQYVRKRDKG